MDQNGYSKIIGYALVVFIIAMIVHIMFKNSEPFHQPDQHETNQYETNQHKTKNTITSNNYIPTYVGKNNNIISSKINREPDGCGLGVGDIPGKPYCPVNKVEDDHMEYLQDFILGQQEPCPKPAISRKQFHKNFFNFRDKTAQSSSFKQDPVDRITQMYLDGNLTEARRYPGMKIKDLFDAATAGPNKHTRSCVRLPKYDSVNYDGLYSSYGSPATSIARDNYVWKYKNDKIINGGQIRQGLYPYDPEYNKNLNIGVYQHI